MQKWLPLVSLSVAPPIGALFVALPKLKPPKGLTVSDEPNGLVGSNEPKGFEVPDEPNGLVGSDEPNAVEPPPNTELVAGLSGK